MGYEYDVVGNFTDTELTEIITIIKNNPCFDGSYVFNGNEIFELRDEQNRAINNLTTKNANKKSMPNVHIICKKDSVYICQNGSSYIWQYLDDLKRYFDNRRLNIDIIDHSN